MKLYCADLRGIKTEQARLPGRSRSRGSAFAASLLAFALEDAFGLESLPEMAETAKGKPFFPLFPDIHFSLSHTDTHVLAAVGAQPMGADIQTRRLRSLSGAKRLTTARERADFNFFDLWALRESLYKLTGAGNLRTLRFSRENGVIIPPVADVNCRLYDDIPNCAAAVSSYGDDFPDAVIMVPIQYICT